MKKFNRNYFSPCIDSSNFLRACKCVRWSFQVTGNKVILGFRFSPRIQPSQQEIAINDIQPDWQISLLCKGYTELTGEWLGDFLVVRDKHRDVVAKIASVNNMLLIRAGGLMSLRGMRESIAIDYGRDSQVWINGGKYTVRISRFQESTPLPWNRRDDIWQADLSLEKSTVAVVLQFGPFNNAEYFMRIMPCDIFSSVEKRAQDWADKLPVVEMKGNVPALFRHLWILHRTHLLEPEGSWKNRWLNYGWFLPTSYHWDFVHNMLDYVWKDAELCARQVEDFFNQSPDESGFMGNDYVLVDENTLQISYHRNYPKKDEISYPPLWTSAVIDTYKWTRDKERLRRLYKICIKKSGWWEKYRRTPEGWFFYKTLGETGYDNMPRAYPEIIDSTSKPIAHLAAVDLNSQMVMYYKDLAEMAAFLKLKMAKDSYRKNAERLSSKIRNGLWSEKDGCFYDLNMNTGKLTHVQSQASFWPLTAGVVSKKQARRLHALMKDRKKFWTYFPIPSMPADSPYFSLDLWRGPTWVSQNYWFIKGLKAYGFRKTAAKLILRTLKIAATLVEKEGIIYEYYNPLRLNTEELIRKGGDMGPIIYYTGHSPFAALFYGMFLGIEPKRKGFSIDPLWEGITEQIRVTFNYKGSQIELRFEPKSRKVRVRYKGKAVPVKNNFFNII